MRSRDGFLDRLGLLCRSAPEREIVEPMPPKGDAEIDRQLQPGNTGNQEDEIERGHDGLLGVIWIIALAPSHRLPNACASENAAPPPDRRRQTSAPPFELVGAVKCPFTAPDSFSAVLIVDCEVMDASGGRRGISWFDVILYIPAWKASCTSSDACARNRLDKTMTADWRACSAASTNWL